MKRYPLQPLVEASGLSEHELSRRIGLRGTPLKRAREYGFLESAADRYACRLGFTPWNVWPDWLDDHEVECAERTCTTMFLPSRKGHRFCSEACGSRRRSRERQRELYRTDPAWAKAKRAEVERYRAENARATKVTQAAYRKAHAAERAAKQRAYYAANRDRILARQARYDATVRAARRGAARQQVAA